ncbi:sensor histidine kinase [Burkholderia guangdongensis]|uniref:sensor histidine kinase n=1 Tax=Burkholderia guangdongensis TaxID=1792500 RepID=UPI0015C93B4E|nr:ATP-binding protein [Burkholderia guangdongensis]
MDTPFIAPLSADVTFPSSLQQPPAGATPCCDAATGRDALAARIAQLSAELLCADEAVRRHLAGELHDGLGAELTAARFALANISTWLPADAPDDCWRALDLAQRALDTAANANRRLVAEQGSVALEGGLVGALAAWIADYAERAGLRTGFVCAADARLLELSSPGALAIFRVAQEALSNVAKHARAKSVDVWIDAGSTHLSLIAVDDGRGFSRSHRRGYGLSGMRARAEAFGGGLEIGSGDGGRGTRLVARFAWHALCAGSAPARRVSHS